MTKAERSTPDNEGLMEPLPSWVSIGVAVYRLPELRAEVEIWIGLARDSARHYRTKVGEDQTEFKVSEGSYWERGIFRFGLGEITFCDSGTVEARLSNDIEEARLWMIGNETDAAIVRAQLNHQVSELAKTADAFALSRLLELWRDGSIKLFGRLGSEAAPFMEVPKTLLGRSKIDRSAGVLKATTTGETFVSLHVEPVTFQPKAPQKTAKGEAGFKRRVSGIIETSPRESTMTVEEFVALGAEMGVSKRASIRIRAQVLSELEPKHPGITHVWAKAGRRPSAAKKSPH